MATPKDPTSPSVSATATADSQRGAGATRALAVGVARPSVNTPVTVSNAPARPPPKCAAMSMFGMNDTTVFRPRLISAARRI